MMTGPLDIWEKLLRLVPLRLSSRFFVSCAIPPFLVPSSSRIFIPSTVFESSSIVRLVICSASRGDSRGLHETLRHFRRRRPSWAAWRSQHITCQASGLSRQRVQGWSSSQGVEGSKRPPLERNLLPERAKRAFKAKKMIRISSQKRRDFTLTFPGRCGSIRAMEHDAQRDVAPSGATNEKPLQERDFADA